MDTNQPPEKASQKIKESGESLKKALTLQFVLIAICFLVSALILAAEISGQIFSKISKEILNIYSTISHSSLNILSKTLIITLILQVS